MFHTALEKKLIAGLVVALALCIVLLATTIAFASQKDTETIVEVQSDSGVCSTEICKSTAKKMIFSMDESTKACDDFYKFVCGNYEEKTKLLPNEYEKGLFSEANTVIISKTKGILKEANWTCDNATCSAAQLYKSCNEQDTSDITARNTIKSLLDNILGGWPILSGSEPLGFNPLLTMANMIRELGHTNPLDVGFSPNMLNTTEFITSLLFTFSDMPRIKGIFPEDTQRAPASISKIEDVIRNVLIALDPTVLNRPTFEIDLKGIIKILEQEATFQKILQSSLTRIQNGFQPEDNLGRLYMVQNGSSYSIHPKYIYTIEELNVLTPTIHWEQFFDIIFKNTGFNFPGNNFKVFTVGTYLQNVTDYFYNTVSRRDVSNYLGWKLVSWSGHLFSKKIADVLSPSSTQSDRCFTFTNNAMGFAVSKLYQEKDDTFDDITEEVKEIFTDLRTFFEIIINQSSWLQSQSRETALRKVQKMDATVGFPEWVKNNTMLNLYYVKLTRASLNGTFEEVFRTARYNYFGKKVDLFSKTLVDKNAYWPKDSPLETNAFYFQNLNRVYLPLGILQFPFYEFGRPRAVNFGGFGYIAGHEIVHGFDVNGILFNENGNFAPWMVGSSSDYYIRGASCFINQYSNIIDQLTNMHLKGDQTLGEDMSDNGGIRAAFLAYKKNKKLQAGRLKGLEKYNEDQLFFISAALNWCTKTSVEAMSYGIKTNDHSPNKYRATVPFQNLPEFSRAFNCPVNTFMNPQNKCRVW